MATKDIRIKVSDNDRQESFRGGIFKSKAYAPYKRGEILEDDNVVLFCRLEGENWHIRLIDKELAKYEGVLKNELFESIKYGYTAKSVNRYMKDEIIDVVDKHSNFYKCRVENVAFEADGLCYHAIEILKQ
ncbi:hypothetical protein GO491_11680 [Flavobacteriaceae bacterium Ap0902]|nr:hypothetical protein [Flavobacteriaceae bacterium Ap0902]